MASTFKTPGVYVQEIRKFPPSVAQVETAIPAFIGHTAMALNTNGESLSMKPWRISSMVDYELYFGGAAPEENITISINETRDAGGRVTAQSLIASMGDRSPYIMYYSLQLYFANGGGPCYIVSVGDYATPVGLGDDDSGLRGGLNLLEKEDEPTLIVFPEAQALSFNPAGAGQADQGALYDFALQQCEKLQDRFAVMDMLPHTSSTRVNDLQNTFRDRGVGNNSLKYGAAYAPNLETIFDYQYNAADVTVSYIVNGAPNAAIADLAALETADKGLYARAQLAINSLPCILPPSPAMVGIYASVDSTRGVWKAPANVSLSGVIRPILKITHEEQENLNVHTSGKSINAIRAFTGKGNLVWGARTLAGNDNEWRYVSVRRFFNMVEESVKKASEQFVFEPNDANTWVRVRAMVENFLLLQWRAGALAGAKPEDAFFVRVGLPETMTAVDILEGRMNVEIGMAVVRPAEFIILRFSHKMQES
ncbi:MAG: phage tail sheath C-terminal domain-containing protein [Bacteroidia bacterium]|nr:phage tail sheath C-terminal domain-containing protein [Bacteroidia bacterium]